MFQRGGSQSAPRCRLIRSHALRQQFLNYRSRSLSGKDWELGISVCSLFAEPQSSGRLRSVLLFATVPRDLQAKAPLAIRARPSRCACCRWQPQNLGHQTCLSLTLGRPWKPGGGRENKEMMLLQASWDSGEHSPWPLDVNEKNYLRLKLLRYANCPLYGEDWKIIVPHLCPLPE